MTAVIVIVVLLAVCALVGWPLYQRDGGTAERRDAEQIADLEAAKQAKYQEIRELELDHRTGKLSDEDFRALDRQLRAEAMTILRRLDDLGADEAPAADRTSAGA